MLLTNHFWLNVNPVDVELDLSNIENATIKVQLANKFNKSDIVKKDIDLDSKKSDLKLKVGNILTFDKIKIVVNGGVSRGGVTP